MTTLDDVKKQTMNEIALGQFNAIADAMNLDADVRKILTLPNNEIMVHFPVRMDDGRIEIFTGYRVQHNNALGPYKGGLRYHPTIDVDDTRALAMWMTWKTSLAGLPYGGAKGGIQMDPDNYSPAELERITRRFTYALGDNIGPEHDIPAPDVNTNEQTMAWIADTYMSTKRPVERNLNKHVVTGKPVGFGGLEGRDRATGFGVFLSLKLWHEKKGESLQGKRFIVQGFGNVGYWAAHFLSGHGAVLTAVQDAHATLINKNGLNVDKLADYSRSNHGSIKGFSHAEEIAHDDFFGLDCDILIPAALGNQITAENAYKISAKVVAEGANGPTNYDGEQILKERDIPIIPDILCNSGGVIASYFEWLQNRNNEIWHLEEILERLEKKFTSVFNKVDAIATEGKKDFRTAAYILAISRIEIAYKQRGIFP